MMNGQDRHSEISPQKFGSENMEKIRLNVGGQKHETYLSTIGQLPDTRLYWIIESVVKSPDYDVETTEIFFDRHPAIFAQILNYYRTGKLHCPTDVCGPLFEQELTYWGIDEKDMEPCCWGNYTQHRDAEENLKNVLYEGTSDEDPVAGNLPVGQSSRAMRLYRRIQPQIWTTLDESRSSTKAKIFSITSILFIIVSVTMFCLNTVPELSNSSTWRSTFNLVETICGAWFTLEFILRMVFCPDKRVFARNWETWIDFLAIAPFYLKFMIRSHQEVINALLLIRLLRLLRFFRLIYGLQVLSHTLKASSYELTLLLFMLLIPVILFSSIVFYIETNLHDGTTKFRSIPHSFWWSLITITTVGYGDMHPESWLGKIVGSMCAICGVVIVALPVSIIGSNFTLFYTHAQARLKLPKKRNKIFLQTGSAVYSGKNFRRKALRRKLISRASDSFSVAYEEGCRSSAQGAASLLNGGLPRNSSLVNDEGGRLSGSSANGKRVVKNRLSNISVPMHDLNSGRHSSEMEEAFVRVTSFSPPPDKSPLLHPSKSIDVTEDDLDDVNIEGLSPGREKRNVSSSDSGNKPEIVPLIFLEGRRVTASSTEGNDGQQSSSDDDGTAECQASGDYGIELKIGLLGENSPEASPTRRVKCPTRRDSALQSISETCSNYNRSQCNTPINTKPSEYLSEKNPTCFGAPFDGTHFNSRQRESNF